MVALKLQGAALVEGRAGQLLRYIAGGWEPLTSRVGLILSQGLAASTCIMLDAGSARWSGWPLSQASHTPAPPPHNPQAARHAASLAAAAGQQAEVAMLCLERLISLGERPPSSNQ